MRQVDFGAAGWRNPFLPFGLAPMTPAAPLLFNVPTTTQAVLGKHRKHP